MYVVTGVSSGLGYELANQLQQAGEDVIGGARHQPDLPIDYHPLDLADGSSVDEFAEYVNGHDMQLQAVIHAAGSIVVPRPITEFSTDDGQRLMAVNAFGPAHLTNRLEPRVVNDGADVVFMSSTGADRATPEQLAYCMSKSALNAYAEAFRVHLAGKSTDARSVLFASGAMDTGMRQIVTGGRPEVGLPTPADVAQFIREGILAAPKAMELGKITFFSRKNRPTAASHDIPHNS